MSTAVAESPAPAPIRSRLAGLRRAVRLWVWLDGGAAVLLTAAGLGAASLLVDRLFRMDRPQRALSLVVGLVALGVVAWRRLIRPLSRRLADEALSLVIESQHGELGQRLISALQFARQGEAGAVGCSPAMVRATIEAGAQAVGSLDFRDALDARKRNHNLLQIGGVMLVGVAAAVLFPSTMGLWFSRNILLSTRRWPQKTHLRVLGAEDDALVCPRGDDLTVHVEADPEGVVPSMVTIRYRGPSGSDSEPMVMVGENVFRTVFKNVLEPFRLRASGGDADTPWCRVRLVERPALETLSLSYVPPQYVGKREVRLPSNIGPHPVPVGSTLLVEVTATKDLAEATLAYAKDEPGACQRTGPGSFRTRIAGERLKSGTYALTMKDTEGYAARQPTRFSLKIVPDRKPTVRARLEGIGDLIVPRATIPVECRMTDDHAVVSAAVVYARHVEGQDEPEPRRLPLDRSAGAFGSREVGLLHRFEAEPLKLPIGSHLTFRVEATDNDAVTGPKVGASATFSLRPVTEDELRAELLRREQEQRMEFERLLRDQMKFLENTRALLASIQDQDTTALADEERRLLSSTEKKQRLVGNRCVAIADRFEVILAEVANNKLEEADSPIRQRLAQHIIEPLRLLARRGVLQAADLLDVAGKAALRDDGDAAEGTPGRQALLDAAAEQQELVESMRSILKYMVKWEGYQEAVSLLREVLTAQEQVNERTVQEYKERIQKIFED
ncbi:MAG: hypothetical protein ACODAJ_06965 [Planctomycetota bacterium]